MIVQRGFLQPASYHEQRLREMPFGYFFDVATNGFGQMSGYAAQIPVEDRWAIAAYVRALQASRHAPVDDLPESDRRQLEALE
jgi:mono/diheme cytochrome c family protein